MQCQIKQSNSAREWMNEWYALNAEGSDWPGSISVTRAAANK